MLKGFIGLVSHLLLGVEIIQYHGRAAEFVNLCNHGTSKRDQSQERSYHTAMDSTNTPKPVPSRRTPSSQAKILVVDDDARLRDLLKDTRTL